MMFRMSLEFASHASKLRIVTAPTQPLLYPATGDLRLIVATIYNASTQMPVWVEMIPNLSVNVRMDTVEFSVPIALEDIEEPRRLNV